MLCCNTAAARHAGGVVVIACGVEEEEDDDGREGIYIFYGHGDGQQQLGIANGKEDVLLHIEFMALISWSDSTTFR